MERRVPLDAVVVLIGFSLSSPIRNEGLEKLGGLGGPIVGDLAFWGFHIVDDEVITFPFPI